MPGSASFDTHDARGQLAVMARELYGEGVLTALGGNLSARIVGADAAWITPAGLYKGGLTPEDMVRVDFGGRVIGGRPGLAPSAEAAVHAGIYRTRADAAAVIHAHPPYGIVLATLGLPIEPVTEEAIHHANVPIIAFASSGSEELARIVSAALRQSDVVLVRSHGVFACGVSIRAAANELLSLEAACRLNLMLRQYATGPLPLLPRPDSAGKR